MEELINLRKRFEAEVEELQRKAFGHFGEEDEDEGEDEDSNDEEDFDDD